MRLTSMGYVVGVVILAGSAFMYARASVSESDSYTEPLVTPASFAPGSVKTFQIMTRVDRNFELVIGIQERRLKTEPSGTDVTWQISDGTGVVAHGSSVDKPWRNWWGTFEQTLGTFPGRVRHHYTLTLQVNHGSPQLDSADPILRVRIPRDDWEGYGAGVAIEKVEAVILSVVGLTVIGISFQLRRRTQKRRAGRNEPDANIRANS